MGAVNNLATRFCALLALAALSTNAADVIKANNTQALVNGSSWVGGAAPSNTDTAVFNDTFTSATGLGTGAPLSYLGLRLDGTLGTTVTVNNTSFANYIETLGGGIDMSASPRNLTIRGLQLGADQQINVAGNRQLYVGGTRFSGTGNFTKLGTGDMRLSVSGGTYTGNVTIDAGRIESNDGGAFDGGTITVNTGGQFYAYGGTHSNSFFINGDGGDSDDPVLRGALRLDNATVSGPITLQSNASIGSASGVGIVASTTTSLVVVWLDVVGFLPGGTVHLPAHSAQRWENGVRDSRRGAETDGHQHTTAGHPHKPWQTVHPRRHPS